MEELRSLGLLATPEQPRPRALEHADLGKLTYLGCAVKVRLLGQPQNSRLQLAVRLSNTSGRGMRRMRPPEHWRAADDAVHRP